MYNGEPLEYDFDYNNEETELLNALLNNNADVSADDVRRVSLWKLDRVLGISEETIEVLRQVAVAPDLAVDDQLATQALQMLVDSQGVWFPMASAILKFLRPDVFPIIDVRAVRALTDQAPRRHNYNCDMYVEYAHRLMEIADENDLELWQVDQQLYCYDIEHNGNI